MSNRFGSFSGTSFVHTTWDENGRTMTLVHGLTYHDPEGRTWHAPAGSVVNGASIPRFFWRLWAPYTGKYRKASVIHDVACDQQTRPSWQVHRMFYFACRACGVLSCQAWIMWAAVRLFGPRFRGRA